MLGHSLSSNKLNFQSKGSVKCPRLRSLKKALILFDLHLELTSQRKPTGGYPRNRKDLHLVHLALTPPPNSTPSGSLNGELLNPGNIQILMFESLAVEYITLRAIWLLTGTSVRHFSVTD